MARTAAMASLRLKCPGKKEKENGLDVTSVYAKKSKPGVTCRAAKVVSRREAEPSGER